MILKLLQNTKLLSTLAIAIASVLAALAFRSALRKPVVIQETLYSRIEDVKHLQHLEQGKVERPPTAERVRRMAELLDEDVDEFIALAGRVPEDLPEIIRSEPGLMPDLLRGAKGLSKKQLEEVLEQMRRMKDKERD